MRVAEQSEVLRRWAIVSSPLALEEFCSKPMKARRREIARLHHALELCNLRSDLNALKFIS